MTRRWAAYLLVGVLFGIADYAYIPYLNRLPWERLFGQAPAAQTAQFVVQFTVLNLGVWLLVVVPVVLYEVRASRSRLRATLASVLVWTTGIVSYYVANAAHLALLGVPARIEMHVTNRGAPYFASNWRSFLMGNVLGGILEWLPVAVVGGAVVGLLVSALSLRRRQAGGAPRGAPALASPDGDAC